MSDKAWIRRPSGLIDQREVPELTLDAAIERSWTIPAGSRLLRPEAEQYLPTYPLPTWHIPACIPWGSADRQGFLTVDTF